MRLLPKRLLPVWNIKWRPPVNFTYSNLCIKFYFEQFWILGQICPRRVFMVKNKKSEYHHWILHIRISLGTKFQLKLTNSSFDKIKPKRESPVKNRTSSPSVIFSVVKVNSAVAFNILKIWKISYLEYFEREIGYLLAVN